MFIEKSMIRQGKLKRLNSWILATDIADIKVLALFLDLFKGSDSDPALVGKISKILKESRPHLRKVIEDNQFLLDSNQTESYLRKILQSSY